jgi:hypothetical protein
MDFQEAEPLLSGDTRGHTFQENNRLYALLAICMCTVALVTFGGTYAGMLEVNLLLTELIDLKLLNLLRSYEKRSIGLH